MRKEEREKTKKETQPETPEAAVPGADVSSNAAEVVVGAETPVPVS